MEEKIGSSWSDRSWQKRGWSLTSETCFVFCSLSQSNSRPSQVPQLLPRQPAAPQWRRRSAVRRNSRRQHRLSWRRPKRTASAPVHCRPQRPRGAEPENVKSSSGAFREYQALKCFPHPTGFFCLFQSKQQTRAVFNFKQKAAWGEEGNFCCCCRFRGRCAGQWVLASWHRCFIFTPARVRFPMFQMVRQKPDSTFAGRLNGSAVAESLATNAEVDTLFRIEELLTMCTFVMVGPLQEEKASASAATSSAPKLSYANVLRKAVPESVGASAGETSSKDTNNANNPPANGELWFKYFETVHLDSESFVCWFPHLASMYVSLCTGRFGVPEILIPRVRFYKDWQYEVNCVRWQEILLWWTDCRLPRQRAAQRTAATVRSAAAAAPPPAARAHPPPPAGAASHPRCASSGRRTCATVQKRPTGKTMATEAIASHGSSVTETEAIHAADLPKRTVTAQDLSATMVAVATENTTATDGTMIATGMTGEGTETTTRWRVAVTSDISLLVAIDD